MTTSPEHDAANLRVGDHVRVRPGVPDPNFEDLEIGGWTGRVTSLGADLGPKTEIHVKWHRRTRLAIPKETEKRCVERLLTFDEMELEQEHLERIDAPSHLALDELLDEMEDAGAWPDPAIIERIITHGESAIEPLREIVRRGCAEPEDVGCADIAAGILGALKATAAVPNLLQLLITGDHDSLEFTADALVAIGDVPIKALEGMLRDPELEMARRAMALQICEGLVEAQPDLSPAVVPMLSARMTEVLEHAKTLTSEDRELVSYVVATLSHIAAPEARPLIAAAFDAEIVEAWIISRRDVDDNYRDAGKMRRRHGRLFLDEYRECYARDAQGGDSDEEWDGSPDEEGSDDEDSDDEGFLDEEAPVAKPIVVTKIGRNDPCPCGSGKKYKKCCLNKPLTLTTAREALVSKLLARAWSVEVELPPATPPKPGTIETHAGVPKDLRQQIERARLESLVLMRSLDQLQVFPTEDDFPPELRKLFELDADCAEALWGLDQKLGKFNVAWMLRDTLGALEALPAARSKVLGVLDDDEYSELEEVKTEIAASVRPDEAYNMVKGRASDAV